MTSSRAKVKLNMQILLVSSKGLQSVSTTGTDKSLSSGAEERSVTEQRSPLVPTTVRVNPVTPPVLNESTAASSFVTVGAVRATQP